MIGCFYFWVRVPKIDPPSQFLKNPFVHSPFLFPPLGLGATLEELDSKLDFDIKANRSCLTDVSFFGLVLAFCSHRSARFLIDEETRPQRYGLYYIQSSIPSTQHTTHSSLRLQGLGSHLVPAAHKIRWPSAIPAVCWVSWPINIKQGCKRITHATFAFN